MYQKVNLPPRLPKTVGVASTTTPKHFEKDDDYGDVIVQLAPRWRVIRCRHRIQWIVQRRSSKHLNKGMWLGKWYCTTRKALITTCSSLDLPNRANTMAVLEALPELITECCKK